MRIGRIKYTFGKPPITPTTTGTYPISLLKSRGKVDFSSLTLSQLKNESGVIFSNLWEFSKLYNYVPFINSSGWLHYDEVHVDADGNITDAYWKWRNKGMSMSISISQPVGYEHAKNYVGFVQEDGQIISEIKMREIVLNEYLKVIYKNSLFKNLKKIIQEKDITILDSEGPHSSSIDYYVEKYSLPSTFIQQETIDATPELLRILILDTLHPLASSYLLAYALLSDEEK